MFEGDYLGPHITRLVAANSIVQKRVMTAWTVFAICRIGSEQML
jgi:hypothetical protein